MAGWLVGWVGGLVGWVGGLVGELGNGKPLPSLALFFGEPHELKLI